MTKPKTAPKIKFYKLKCKITVYDEFYEIRANTAKGRKIYFTIPQHTFRLDPERAMQTLLGKFGYEIETEKAKRDE